MRDRAQAPPSASRRRLLQAAVGLAVAGLAGCDSASLTPRLRIAIQPWSGYQFMRLAQVRGWLAPGIELLPMSSAVQAVGAMSAGDIEGAALTLDEAMQITDLGVPLDIVLVCNVSAGADVVLARAELAGLEDLRGRRIAVEDTTLGTVMLSLLLDRAGLSERDVLVVPMGKDHLTAWRELQPLDAIVTYEPWSILMRNVGLVPLLDSRALPQTIFDVLALRRGLDAGESRLAANLVAGHFRAVQLWRENPIDTSYALAQLMGVPASDVQDVYKDLDLPDAAYNRHYLSGPSAELVQATQYLSRTLLAHGRMNAPTDPTRLFTPRYLPRLDG